MKPGAVMRIPALIALASLPASAQLRGTTNILKDPGRIAIEYALRADPPSSALEGKFIALHPRARTPVGRTFFSRILLDTVHHTYFGYELFVEQQQPGAYLATFGKLGVTPLDLAGALGGVNLDWTSQPVPELPKPRVIHDNELLSIVLFQDPASGARLIDDIKITPPPRITGFLPVPVARPPARPAPTASGPPRDFTASDAELQITNPRGVTLNGVRQASIPLRNVHGSLVWLYIPDQGRYVMSLTPRPDLNFKKAGEVRGGLISFTVDGDAITLECPTPIASGDAAYHLYILHDEDWEPISEAQKTRPTLGSVSPAELAALKK